MRKVGKILISIVIICSIVTLVVLIIKPKPIPKGTGSVVARSDLAFAVLGDIHENIDSFQEAINDLYTINSNMDALVLNGDVVDQGSDKQYNSMKKTIDINKEILPKKVIINIGNHEFYNYDIKTNSPEQVKAFINRYLEFTGEGKVYHDTWVNDYHFISLGSEDGNSQTINSTNASISEIQQKWLKEKLAEKYKKGKPIFVFLHQPLDYGDRSKPAIKQGEVVREILTQYPEVILFSSHMHKDLNENSVMVNQPFTICNTGAVHYTIVPDVNSKGGKKRMPYIKGVYIEVNGDKVTIKGRDIKDKQWIFAKEITKE